MTPEQQAMQEERAPLQRASVVPVSSARLGWGIGCLLAIVGAVAGVTLGER
jgi:hypothetical protein